MNGISAEYPDSKSHNPLIGVHVREEPDEEEDEGEDDGKQDGDDDDEDDDGYSE